MYWQCNSFDISWDIERRSDIININNQRVKRTKNINIRLSQEEYDEFVRKAQEKGLDVSSYIRYLVKTDK